MSDFTNTEFDTNSQICYATRHYMESRPEYNLVTVEFLS
jgi:hypothetical protein